ncbi:MAG: hypothetical protein ACQESF_04125 [Nanobdellota archaeon]
MIEWEEVFSEREIDCKYKEAQGFMDSVITDYVLVDSYHEFKERNNEAPYPFVQPESLRPINVSGDVISESAADFHNSCLIFLTKENLTEKLKWDFRFRKENRLNKENLKKEKSTLMDSYFVNNFNKDQQAVGKDFKNTLENLKNTDLAMLVSQLDSSHSKPRYGMTHYRVPVVKNFVNSVEELANELGYLENSFSDNGSFDETLEKNLTHKFFEYHGFSHIIGGKRTAASNGSHILRKNGFDFTTYAGSTESRSLTRITNQGVAKYILTKIDPQNLEKLTRSFEAFEEDFLIDSDVALFRVVYQNNNYSMKSDQRALEPKRQWLDIVCQHLLPVKPCSEYRPIKYNIVYGKKDPLK